MTQRSSLHFLAACAAVAVAAYPIAAPAQLLGYEDVDAPPAGRSDDDAPERDDAPARRVAVVPYIELQQLLVADLNDGGDVLTYTAAAAGVSAAVATHRAEAQADVRYERRIAWNRDLDDTDVVSGLARARVDVVPSAVSMEGGALATRARGDIGGAAPGIFVGDTDNTVDVYSLYAGPNVSTRVGDATLNAAYRFGYNRVENDGIEPVGGPVRLDAYDDSTNHLATASIGVQPGPLPVGLALGAGYEREDTSQLDQRYEGKWARVDATAPVSPTLAVVAGVGYEDIAVSQRDVLRDGAGDPVVDANGRFVTDPASPRRLTFDTDGLIYDAGVLWRPSRRTALEARAGRRYGDFFFAGSYQQQIDSRTNLAFGAYQNFSSYGRRLTNALAGLPTQFESVRNPLDGSLGSCVFGVEGATGGCLDAALASTTTANFVARGIAGQLSMLRGGWTYGFGAGVDQRRFKGTDILGSIDLEGVTDESYYASLAAGTRLDARSQFDALAYLRYFDPGLGFSPEVLSYGASAAYRRQFTRGLSGVAALGLNGYSQDGGTEELAASALLGARYSF